MDNILEIKNLIKRYDDFVLDNVSFSLPRGYIMGFVGQNGSGKTTTIRSILNMANIDSGKITVLGYDSIADEIEIKERIGVVFDSLYFAGHLKIKEIESQLKGFYKNWDSKGFYEKVKSFNLSLKKKVGIFSKGMKMKLMIAVSLSHNAEFIILDEPTSGLDPVARDELLDILSEYISDENKGILFSTHITADVERIADYVTVLHDGKVWFTGTKDELVQKYIIVKGDETDFSDELKSKCLGFHAYRNGCDAMTERKYLKELPDGIEYEKANVDDILVYVAKEDKNAKNQGNN